MLGHIEAMIQYELKQVVGGNGGPGSPATHTKHDSAMILNYQELLFDNLKHCDVKSGSVPSFTNEDDVKGQDRGNSH